MKILCLQQLVHDSIINIFFCHKLSSTANRYLESKLLIVWEENILCKCGSVWLSQGGLWFFSLILKDLNCFERCAQLAFVQTACLESTLHLLQEYLASRGQSYIREQKKLTARTITCSSKKHTLAVFLFSNNSENIINLILDLKLNLMSIVWTHHNVYSGT